MSRDETQPPLRRQFDRVERAIGARLEEVVATRQFTDAMILALRVQSGALHLLERGSRQVLHLWNIPTRSDVMRVSRQLSALDGRIRAIALALERDDLLSSGPDRSGGTDASSDP